MYNALTGRNEKVGNWAGVTVERKEHPIKKAYHSGGEELIAVDLPGAYSMSPFTSEESITSSYVKKENPDVIINIVDGTNLSRSLFFTTQLLELGIPIFAVFMWIVFQISQVWVGTPIADWLVGLLETFQARIGELLGNANPLLSALLVDGVIGGVIAVVGFLPLVMVMYFLIALLEDCGYMSRVAVVLDPIFKKVGLSGKSVTPFVIGIGCGVPGIMAIRTIRNERERELPLCLHRLCPTVLKFL